MMANIDISFDRASSSSAASRLGFTFETAGAVPYHLTKFLTFPHFPSVSYMALGLLRLLA